MRYIGNKTKLLDVIRELLDRHGCIDKNFVLCDAFSGTASVSDFFKRFYRKIIANDNLFFASVIAEAKLNPPDMKFSNLGFDPFVYFNNVSLDGYSGDFIFHNYCPHGGRQFFSDTNALLIDFIRHTIEEWYDKKMIDDCEKYYLLASLVESVSLVANVAGVYGACLHKWDPRALKPLIFKPLVVVDDANEMAEVHNEDVLSLVSKVCGDVLYLDPPYTHNSYSTQYHLLDTIAKGDSPDIKGKGGLRDMSLFISPFCKSNDAEIALEYIIRNAHFRYVILSYSSDGIISKDFIESLFKRYSVDGTYEFQSIVYRRYKNAKAEDKQNHAEYLFFMEKKPSDQVVYASPLNYIGGKYDMVDFLRAHMPLFDGTFYDLFGGGMSVSINSCASTIVYNDINFKVRDFLVYLLSSDLSKFLATVAKQIKTYGLSAGNKDAYLALRKHYNVQSPDKRDFVDFFLLVMYGFQQQIRFNSRYEYNNPVGQACFNESVKEKLVSFVGAARGRNILLYANDYEVFESGIHANDFVYLDPPYLLTLGSYNDGKRGFNGWNISEERRLLEFLERLNDRKIKFMLSNVSEHKGVVNTDLLDWAHNHGFIVTPYGLSGRRQRREIIITNYVIE